MPKVIDHEAIRRYALNRLYWFGDLSAKDLKRLFSVGSDFTSRFIGELRKQVPLEAVGKRYELKQGLDAKKVLGEQVSGSELLARLFLAVAGQEDIVRSCGGQIPAWSMDHARRAVKDEVLRGIIWAINNAKSIEIVYASMKPGEVPKKRTVEPIGFGHAGGRWHLDAYCYLAQGRRDFVLSRIIAIGDTHNPRFGHVRTQNSLDEHEKVHASFVPHPLLSPEQVEVLKFEFGMDNDNVLRLHETKGRLFYFRKQFVAKSRCEGPPEKLLIEVEENMT